MLSEQTIRTLLAFLQRSQLSGAEAPAFVQAVNELQMLLKPQEPPKTAE